VQPPPNKGNDNEIIDPRKSVSSASSACEKNTLENIILHPNPTTGELIITNHELKITNIEIYDVDGRKLSSNHLITPSSHQKIDISHLTPGIYFVKIVTTQGEIVKKVIKQ
jgi:hypothetical protein